jgi:hypothetical protein
LEGQKETIELTSAWSNKYEQYGTMVIDIEDIIITHAHAPVEVMASTTVKHDLY